MADPIVKWHTIVFIHADANERVRRSVLLGVRTALFVGLERVDALGVDLLDLVLRDVFQRVACACGVLLALLRVGLVMILFHQIVTQLYLLGL